MFLGLLALALACPTWATWANNMNPQNYTIANPVVSKTPVSMPFHGEYFELLGPESTTHYSEVLWHTQPLDLPAEIVARFDGKVTGKSTAPTTALINSRRLVTHRLD